MTKRKQTAAPQAKYVLRWSDGEYLAQDPRKPRVYPIWRKGQRVAHRFSLEDARDSRSLWGKSMGSITILRLIPRKVPK